MGALMPELADRYFDWAMDLANKYASRLPAHADKDAIRGAAAEALTIAASRFDRSRNDSFTGYAGSRIWWAMQDEVRRNGHLGRGEYASMKRGDHEHRTHKGRVVPITQVASLNHPLTEESALSDVLADRNDPIGAALDWADLVRQMSKLPPRQARVLYSIGLGFPLAEIAGELGVTESRVSQIAQAARERLETRLAA